MKYTYDLNGMRYIPLNKHLTISERLTFRFFSDQYMNFQIFPNGDYSIAGTFLTKSGNIENFKDFVFILASDKTVTIQAFKTEGAPEIIQAHVPVMIFDSTYKSKYFNTDLAVNGFDFPIVAYNTTDETKQFYPAFIREYGETYRVYWMPVGYTVDTRNGLKIYYNGELTDLTSLECKFFTLSTHRFSTATAFMFNISAYGSYSNKNNFDGNILPGFRNMFDETDFSNIKLAIINDLMDVYK